MTDNKLKEGWGWPSESRLAHYFRDDHSLCGHWPQYGIILKPEGAGDKNCPLCAELLEGRKPPVIYPDGGNL